MHVLRLFILALFLPMFAASMPAARGSAALSMPGGASALDPVSSGCLSCHDGSEGPHVRYCLLSQMGIGCGGHIISASYAEMAARKSDLHPTSRLPAELVLFEGKITCVTCHGSDPHSGNPLAMENRNSALCRACHLK